jgi:hypothetical protein
MDIPNIAFQGIQKTEHGPLAKFYDHERASISEKNGTVTYDQFELAKVIQHFRVKSKEDPENTSLYQDLCHLETGMEKLREAKKV